MTACLLSFAVGIGVGLIYGALGVRSPAPPVIALVGLLGMLCGERAMTAIKTWRQTPEATQVTATNPASGAAEQSPAAHLGASTELKP